MKYDKRIYKALCKRAFKHREMTPKRGSIILLLFIFAQNFDSRHQYFKRYSNCTSH